MGCAASIGANPIDAALMQALVEARKKRNVPDLTFTELLLKFPKMAAGFVKVRKYFQMLDTNGDRVIDLGEFVAQAHKVGLDMKPEELKNVFDAADIDHSTKIDVFEFVLVFLVVHLLFPERAQALPQEIRATLEIVEDAFCCFDASADGYLEREEVQTALSMSATPGRVTRDLSDKLFTQLDFDGSGGISCKEFLIGLEKMVLEEYGDGDEEEDETDAAIRHAEEEQLLAQTQMQRQQQQLRKAAELAAAAGGGPCSNSSGSGGSLSAGKLTTSSSTGASLLRYATSLLSSSAVKLSTSGSGGPTSPLKHSGSSTVLRSALKHSNAGSGGGGKDASGASGSGDNGVAAGRDPQ